MTSYPRSCCRRAPLSTVAAALIAAGLTLCIAACGESAADPEPETDSALCARLCKQLPTVCPRFLDDLNGDCQTSCMTPEDSSTEFRRCMANAASCDDLVVCKNTY